jgi:hypothetical protein
VVSWDHRDVLTLAGVSRAEFEREVRDRAGRLARAVRKPVLRPEVVEVPGTASL